MASTTTAFTACDYVLKLDDAAGNLVDISTSTSKVEANFDNQVGEFRTFGSEWMTRIQCGKDASFNITGIATTNVSEIRELIEDWFFNGNGMRTFTLSQPGDSVGNIAYSAECILKTFKFSGEASSADPVMYEIELVPSGAVTRTVIV